MAPFPADGEDAAGIVPVAPPAAAVIVPMAEVVTAPPAVDRGSFDVTCGVGILVHVPFNIVPGTGLTSPAHVPVAGSQSWPLAQQEPLQQYELRYVGQHIWYDNAGVSGCFGLGWHWTYTSRSQQALLSRHTAPVGGQHQGR